MSELMMCSENQFANGNQSQSVLIVDNDDLIADYYQIQSQMCH